MKLCACVNLVDPEECNIEKGDPGPPGPPGLTGEVGHKGKHQRVRVRCSLLSFTTHLVFMCPIKKQQREFTNFHL